MGAEDTPKRGFFSTRTTFKNRSTIFTLGSRDTVLTTELEDPIIVVPHAQKTEKRVRLRFSLYTHVCTRFTCIMHCTYMYMYVYMYNFFTYMYTNTYTLRTLFHVHILTHTCTYAHSLTPLL